MVSCGEWTLQIKNEKVAILAGVATYFPEDKDITILNNAIQFVYKGLKYEVLFEDYVVKRHTQTISEMQRLGIVSYIQPSILNYVYDLFALYQLSHTEVLVDKPECNPQELLKQYVGYRECLEQVNWSYVLSLIEVKK